MNHAALRYFNEVTRAGSIAAACEHLHVARSAVSRQIAALEKEIGVPLFERRPRGMSLTGAGKVFAAHVKLSLIEQDRVIASLRSGEVGSRTIRIVVSQVLAGDVIARAACELQREFRDIRFDVRALPGAETASAIIDGDADIGLTYAFRPHVGLEAKHRFIVPTHVILSPRHRLAGRKTLTLEDISECIVAVTSDSTVHDVIRSRAAILGLNLDNAFECNYNEGVFSYCASGEAVTFAPRLSAAGWIRQGKLIAVPLLERKVFEQHVEVQVMERRKLPSYVHECIKFLANRLASELRD